MVNEIIGLDWHFAFMPQGHEWTTHRKIFSRDFNSAVISKFNPSEIKWNRIFLRNLLTQPEAFLTHIQHLASGLALDATHGYKSRNLANPILLLEPRPKLLKALPLLGFTVKHIPSWIPSSPSRQAREWRVAVDIAKTVPFSVATAAKAGGQIGPSVLSDLLDSKQYQADDIRTTTAAMFANGSAAVSSNVHDVRPA
ncbi:hypothetical protein VNI00_006586 [Paramarasmius palmivorus]|uniref:Uncharacterized protein n=1 Tax=Paramarasmius palmivorus TaxID=297713 RepID=A0AAW0D967_9AGAR